MAFVERVGTCKMNGTPSIVRRRSSPDKQSIVTKKATKPPPASSPIKHQRSESCPTMADTTSCNIRTAIRIRPRTQDVKSPLTWLRTRQTLGRNVVEVEQKPSDSKLYTPDVVFGEAATQQDVFDGIGKATVDVALAGYNSSIIAYGQSGSGKTFTMHGDQISDSWHRGLVLHMLEDLFAKLPPQFECVISFVEIYNEKLYDLLDATATDAKPIREDTGQNEVFVQDLVQVPVLSPGEALEWLQRGAKARKVASTSIHKESSRAHAVFSIKLRQQIGDQVFRKSVLHCVDLAGSEKHSPMEKGVKEASHINKSLSCLVGVIIALANSSLVGKRHIPYRDSKLTFLLRDALGGNSKTTLIGTITTEEKCINETLSTLQFIEKATHITTRAKPNEEAVERLILSLQSEVAQLKQTLAKATKLDIPASIAEQRGIEHEEAPRNSERSTSIVCQTLLPPWYTSVLLVAVGFCIGRYFRRR